MFDKTFQDFFHEVNGPIWILIGLIAPVSYTHLTLPTKVKV